MGGEGGGDDSMNGTAAAGTGGGAGSGSKKDSSLHCRSDGRRKGVPMRGCGCDLQWSI